MANIFDVAKYILEKQSSTSTWKLQKLCYYAQAWTLAWDSVSLFSEDFQAWTNGPVCKELYDEHKGRFQIKASDLNKGDSTNLTENEKENVDIILTDYGSKEAYWLREQTHGEDPWKNARGTLTEDVPCTTVIEKDAMGIYYGGL